MKGKIIDSEKLFKEERWNTKYFVGDNNRKMGIQCEVRPLNDLVTERKQTLNPQEYSNHLFNYIGLENIESDSGDLIEYNPKTGSQILSRSKVFRNGDILYGKLRPNLNKVYLVDDKVYEGICSSEFFVLIPNKNLVQPIFLRTILTSYYVLNYVKEITTGVALPRLQLEDFLRIRIPCPPLKEQQLFEQFITAVNQERIKASLVSSETPKLMINMITKAIENGGIPRIKDFKFKDEPSISWKNPLPRIGGS